jgi:hypothetical protein
MTLPEHAVCTIYPDASPNWPSLYRYQQFVMRMALALLHSTTKLNLTQAKQINILEMRSAKPI